LLCFIYIVGFGGVLSYQWFNFGTPYDFTSAFGNKFDGYSNIRSNQAYADKWRGALTDEALRDMVKDYQDKSQSGQRQDFEETDWTTLNSWVRTLWPELEKPGAREMVIDYIDPDKLIGFYERRLEKVEEFLEMNGQSGQEKDYFLQMDSLVSMPFNYDWVEGCAIVAANSVSDIGMVLGLFLAIALSPMFSNEWHDNAKPLIATTRNGWQKTAMPKTGASLAFTLELFSLIFIGSIGAQFLFMGTRGWDMPMQCIKLLATAPMNMRRRRFTSMRMFCLQPLGMRETRFFYLLC
jgi:hypothetical protein